MTRLAATVALLLMNAAGTAFAASADEVRSADQRVAQRQKALSVAQQSGDPVTIATERAALQAATATAWGRRNPAPIPKARKKSR